MNTMTDNPVTQRIRQTIDNSDVVLFMKGTPVFPQCGFSSTMVQVLSLMGVKFKGFDVLEDPEVREGIKSFSEWPTKSTRREDFPTSTIPITAGQFLQTTSNRLPICGT